LVGAGESVLRTDAEDPSPGTRILGREATTARSSTHPGLFFRVLGTTCLVGALVVAAYLGWLLWGTGIGTAHEQHHLRQEIAERIAQPRALDPQTRLPTKPIPEGAPVGILRIPRIHLDMVVVNGTSTGDLKKGPGHYIGTAYPWEASGRVAIAGHRTTYLHPFGGLDKLRSGDLIRLDTEYGKFDYHVTGSRVILPSGAWVLRQTKAPTLVLTTCTPRFSASHRLVVFASQ
jgi:sortase A